MKTAIEALRYVNLAAIVVIALACTYQWKRYRTAPSRWVAIAFGTIGGISILGLFLHDDASESMSPWLLKPLLAVLILFPYFLYRFCAAFETPGRLIRVLADGSTLALMLATFAIPYIPAEDAVEPVWWSAFLAAVMAQWSYLFVVVTWRLWRAGKGQPTVPRRRMRTLAVATATMNLSILLGHASDPVDVSVTRLVLRVLSVAGSALLLIGLSPPPWLLFVWRRKEGLAFQRAMGAILSAKTMQELSDALLPPTTSLIGARGAQLLSLEGRIVGTHGDTAPGANEHEHRVEMNSGTLVLWVSPYAPFFGRNEMEMTEGLGGFADMAMERFLLADSQRESAATLAHQAGHDALTGLPNRVMFLRRLAESLARLDGPPGKTVTVQFLDLDRFKVVNDGIDHAAGDRLLVAVAERLSASVRDQDIVARFGGDEFVVLAEVCDETEALRVADRLVAGLSEPFLIAGRELNITASVGVVVTSERCEPDVVVRDADTAMYRAKDSGRARVVLFDDELRTQSVRRLEMERSLRSAISEGTLRLHYQPMVRLSDGAAVGVEALFRWQHPRFGLLHANSLIELAEESDLIGIVGTWVLREACRQAAEWRRTIPGLELKMWVNVSPAQFMYRDVARDAEEALIETGLDASALGLEITETVLIEETARVQDAFTALKKLGVAVAIDDFGTGYSSLGALKRFPADVLKIDGSFVMGLGRDPQDTAIVTACIALGDAMGLNIIAEAVETDEQRKGLLAMGCEFGQGFHFNPPLPAAQAENYLRSHIPAADAEANVARPALRIVLPGSTRVAAV